MGKLTLDAEEFTFSEDAPRSPTVTPTPPPAEDAEKVAEALRQRDAQLRQHHSVIKEQELLIALLRAEVGALHEEHQQNQQRRDDVDPAAEACAQDAARSDVMNRLAARRLKAEVGEEASDGPKGEDGLLLSAAAAAVNSAATVESDIEAEADVDVPPPKTVAR